MEERTQRFNEAYDYLVWRHVIRKQGDLGSIMGTSRTNISAALNGNPKVLTESFLKRFYIQFQQYFDLDWLLYGEGEMLKDSTYVPPPAQNSEKEKAAEVTIVTLAATLIKETEDIRRQLTQALQEVSDLRVQLAKSIRDLQNFNSGIKAEYEASIKLSGNTYPTAAEYDIPKVAEVSEP